MIDNAIVMTAVTGLGWCALAGVGLVLVARRKNHRRRAELLPAWNAANASVGTHDGVVTRKAEAAISAKHLLGKPGSNPDQVAVAGVNDAPLYVMPDEAEAAGDAITCEVLGVVDRTVRMVASGLITVGSQVAPAADGKVRPLPSLAGTYHVVGRAVTGTATDGDLVEVASCVARQVVVS